MSGLRGWRRGLERGVGEDTTELRDERVERLEEGIGELEEERMEEASLALVDFFIGTVFCLGRLCDLTKISSSADSSLELSKIAPLGSLLRLTLATLLASLNMSSSSSSSPSLAARISIPMVAVGTAEAFVRLSVVSLTGALPFLVIFGVSSICSTVSSASPLSEVSEDSADLKVSSLSMETLADTSTSSRFSWESSFESSTRV